MADERWITVKDGQLVLVTELDGWAYLRAKDHGKQTRWETPTTLEQLARTWGGTGSRLYQEALAALAQHEGPPQAGG